MHFQSLWSENLKLACYMFVLEHHDYDYKFWSWQFKWGVDNSESQTSKQAVLCWLDLSQSDFQPIWNLIVWLLITYLQVNQHNNSTPVKNSEEMVGCLEFGQHLWHTQANDQKKDPSRQHLPPERPDAILFEGSERSVISSSQLVAYISCPNVERLLRRPLSTSWNSALRGEIHKTMHTNEEIKSSIWFDWH